MTEITARKSTRSGRWLVVLLLLAGISVVTYFIVQYLARPVAESDFETYASIEELSAASDAVVMGTVQGELLKWDDRGGDPEEIEGVPVAGRPMALYEVTVSDPIGGTDPGASLVLARTDVSRVRSDLSTLQEGTEVVLFLEKVTRAEAPDLPDGYDEVWVVVAGDGGVFDLDGQTVRPRLGATRLEDSGPESSSFSIAEVSRVVG